MTTTEMAAAQASDPTRNGVDTATLFATLDAVKGDPRSPKFQFRAHQQWVSGTHNRSTIHGFFGAGEETTHRHRSSSTPTTRPCWSARTTARHRPSSCCTPWPPASPPASPTSPPPAASLSPRSARPSRATSTCSASSGF